MTETRYQVFLSSTFADLETERLEVSSAILRLPCLLAGMEQFPASNRPPWDVISPILDTTDYFVLIIAGRYGSLGPDGRSYTEIEYEYARSKSVPILAFVHSDPSNLSVSKSDTDPATKARLTAFRQRVEDHHTIKRWAAASDLVSSVTTALARAFISDPRPGWVRNNADQSRAPSSENGALELLERQIERDPVPSSARKQAHLFAVAEPVSPRSEMLLSHLDFNSLPGLVRNACEVEVVRLATGASGGFSPGIESASQYSRRSDGAALSTPNLTPDRSFVPDAYNSGQFHEDLVDVELSEDGGVRLLMTRLSDDPGDGYGQRLFEAAAVIYVRQIIGLAAEIAERTEYSGLWQLAVGATGIKGLAPYTGQGQDSWGPIHAFEDDNYRRGALASSADLMEKPGTLTSRLLGRFLRQLGREARFTQALTDSLSEVAGANNARV